MDFQNKDGFNGQGGFGSQFPPQPQGNQPQQPLGFEQMTQEFNQGYAQDASGSPSNQNPLGQAAQPDWNQNPFGSPSNQDPLGQAAQPDWNQDPFGSPTSSDPFSSNSPFASVNSTDDSDLSQKWWQKGARIILLGGAGILLLAIVVFIIATNINKGKSERPINTSPVQEPYIESYVQESYVQESYAQESYVQETQAVTQVSDGAWQLISNTDGYTFVATKTSEFVVQSKGVLYLKQLSGGMQVRSVAVGTLDGYDGTYEVDLPRSAVLYKEVIKGYKFSVMFDVYTSADGNSIFVENLRPER